MSVVDSRPLKYVLSQIAQVSEAAPVDVEDYDGSQEWFLLESDPLWDWDLHHQLAKRWARIVGPYASQFALVYCETEPHAGVWLHYLKTPQARLDYWHGCCRVSSWY
jgi:hypothetical protein